MMFSFRKFLAENANAVSCEESFKLLVARLRQRDSSHKDRDEDKELASRHRNTRYYSINVCSIPSCALLPLKASVYFPLSLKLYPGNGDNDSVSLDDPYYYYANSYAHLEHRGMHQLKGWPIDIAYATVISTVKDLKKEILGHLSFYQVSFYLILRHVTTWPMIRAHLYHRQSINCAKLAQLDYHEWIKLLNETGWDVFTPAQLDQLRLASLSDDPDQIGVPDDV